MDSVLKYRDKDLCQTIIQAIKKLTNERINIMEVCGTHTVSIFRSGIREILPKNIHLISGPGCPVCVTPVSEIDHLIALSRMKNTIIVTFGDMLNVPGSTSSLRYEKAKGAKVQVVYSPLQALELARQFPNKKVILLGVGFETTIPLLASVVLNAFKESIKNFFFLSLAKTMPPIMEALLRTEDTCIDGFLCPGHVSAIIGTRPFQFIPEKYQIPCVIAGFEPVDILIGIYGIIRQKIMKKAFVQNEYQRVVREEGNQVALKVISQVFVPVKSEWRGIGQVEMSGMDLQQKYSKMNARFLDVKIEKTIDQSGCRCGDVLRGKITPVECPLFKRICCPENPVGACMVSSEGSCAAYYQYSLD